MMEMISHYVFYVVSNQSIRSSKLRDSIQHPNLYPEVAFPILVPSHACIVIITAYSSDFYSSKMLPPALSRAARHVGPLRIST